MPWNDNSKPGPWGSPPDGDKPEGGKKPKSPWERAGDDGPKAGPGRRSPGGGGGGPSGPGGGAGGPDIDAIVQRLRRRFDNLFDSDGRPNRRALSLGAAVVAGFWALSGVYVVQPAEEAVVTTFGAYTRSTGPGLGYRLPWPVENHTIVNVQQPNVTDVGGGGPAENLDESLMLTGDENIVDLDFNVQWRVSDPAAYLFRVRDPDAAVKMVAESAMREVVGRTPLADVLTTRRGAVQTETAQLMQRVLDQYGAGVTVVEVQINNAVPPAQVVPAFREVQTAAQNREALINQGRTYYNRVVNEAKGDAARIRQEAEGYRERVVREAQGEAARFNQIYEQYRSAPGVTRDRLYQETMQRVLSRSNKIVVDGNGATAPVILPPEVFQRRPAPNASQQPAVVQPQPQPQAQAGAAR